MAVEDFANVIAQESSYLFQKKLSSHDSLVDLTGDSLTTFRIALLFQEQGPQLFRVVWRIPTGRNMADNFWRPGNLVAHVDCDNCKVYSVIQSVEPSGFVDLGHDDLLGKRFLRSKPPLYDDAIELVMKASRVFPRFGYQAWDVAVTDDGPVIIEMNHNGGIDILQMGAREGIMDEQFSNLLAAKGLKLKNPKIPFSG